MEKLAWLQIADEAGRDMAEAQAVEELAKMAGALLAHGHLTPEQLELLKEAGLLSSLGGGIARLGRRAVSGVRGTAQNVAGRLRASSAVSKAMKAAPASTAASSGPSILRRRAGKVTPVTPASKVYSGEAGQVVQGRAPKVEAVTRRGKPSAAPAASAAPADRSGAGYQRMRIEQTPTGAKATPMNQGPYRSQAAGAPEPAGRVKPAQTQQAAPQQAAKSQAAATPAPADKGKGVGWGRMMAYGGLGLGAYGLYRGAGWGARQLEQASTTPMAYGGGWSPVDYGYGPNPYGAGIPNMGMGA